MKQLLQTAKPKWLWLSSLLLLAVGAAALLSDAVIPDWPQVEGRIESATGQFIYHWWQVGGEPRKLEVEFDYSYRVNGVNYRKTETASPSQPAEGSARSVGAPTSPEQSENKVWVIYNPKDPSDAYLNLHGRGKSTWMLLLLLGLIGTSLSLLFGRISKK